jgi:hypothetical protein
MQALAQSLPNLALQSTRAIRTGTYTLLPRRPITSAAVPYKTTKLVAPKKVRSCGVCGSMDCRGRGGRRFCPGYHEQ